MDEILAFAMHHQFLEMSRTEMAFAIVDTNYGQVRCYHVVEERQDFFVAQAHSFKFISQNMRKNSPNTRWIDEDPANRFITWVTQGSNYVGQVKTFVGDRGHMVTSVEVF